MNYQQYPYQQGQQQPHYHPPAAPPPAPKKKKWPYVLGGIAALIVLGSAMNSGKSGATGSSASPTPSSGSGVSNAQPAVQQPVPQSSGPATSMGAGSYQVGTDIVAGRYKTTGPDKSSIFPNCYWERSKDDSGEFKSIISNDNIQGPGTLSVKAGEFLKLTGGCEWVKQ